MGRPSARPLGGGAEGGRRPPRRGGTIHWTYGDWRGRAWRLASFSLALSAGSKGLGLGVPLLATSCITRT